MSSKRNRVIATLHSMPSASLKDFCERGKICPMGIEKFRHYWICWFARNKQQYGFCYTATYSTGWTYDDNLNLLVKMPYCIALKSPNESYLLPESSMLLNGFDNFLSPQCLFCGKSPDYAENFQSCIISFSLYVTIVLHSIVSVPQVTKTLAGIREGNV